MGVGYGCGKQAVPGYVVKHLIGNYTHSFPGELNVVEEISQPLHTNAILAHLNLSVQSADNPVIDTTHNILQALLTTGLQTKFESR